ncbi:MULTISPECIES: DUF1869 domain-containing protein [Raoultella]|uniref:DUF1869 domain-containing protein n=1 Tax=Raoultella TaxID=160674 RepID=UPI002167ECDC|nr:MULTISPECIES: DUF1869 domain-containing protein [Raoultella]MCS4269621.1 hypothetical protein [Raoultella sp. BIGb0132]MCS4286581.1 hypothetical protein [Raoultella terrigena]
MKNNEQAYALELVNIKNKKVAKIHLESISGFRTHQDYQFIIEKLLSEVAGDTLKDEGVRLTLTNQLSGISVEREYSSYSFFKDINFPTIEINQLITIVMGYEEAEDLFIHE